MLATEGSNANSYDQFRFANDDEQEIARWRAEISWRHAARHEALRWEKREDGFRDDRRKAARHEALHMNQNKGVRNLEVVSKGRDLNLMRTLLQGKQQPIGEWQLCMTMMRNKSS
ncbi:ABC transporter ATP-binding protein [Sesbania bispinosa]|nr:ABC transporter ATP-binding protein [Sesbania bispinosa]